MRMKKMFKIAIVLAALEFVTLPLAIAQGTLTYMSSLNKPSGGSLPVAANAWWAQGFGIGPNSPRYTLGSIQLSMANGSGLPSGFAVSLYSADDAFAFPADKLWTLSGAADPILAGVYNYSSSDVVLSPSTGYFIVVTASQPLVSGSYQWSFLANGFTVDASEGWGLGHFVSSADGSTWGRNGTAGPFQFAINATAIPEPSPVVLCLCGGALWLAARGRRRNG